LRLFACCHVITFFAAMPLLMILPLLLRYVFAAATLPPAPLCHCCHIVFMLIDTPLVDAALLICHYAIATLLISLLLFRCQRYVAMPFSFLSLIAAIISPPLLPCCRH